MFDSGEVKNLLIKQIKYIFYFNTLALLQYKSYYTGNFVVIMFAMLHVCSTLNRWAPGHNVISKDNGHERSYRLAA